ncbi:MAG: hypothetical protein ABEJ08_02725 [Halobacteriaceae archaeon]
MSDEVRAGGASTDREVAAPTLFTVDRLRSLVAAGLGRLVTGGWRYARRLGRLAVRFGLAVVDVLASPRPAGLTGGRGPR